MSEDVYYVILADEEGELNVSKFTKIKLINMLHRHMRMDEKISFVEALGTAEEPSDWIGEGDSAMLIIKGGKIVVPNITEKTDYKCDIE